jgi:hypothetical protein
MIPRPSLMTLCLVVAGQGLVTSGLAAAPPSCAVQVDPSTFKAKDSKLVIGDAQERIYLHPQHPDACRPKSSGFCKPTAYIIAGQNVSIGNTCGDWTSVRYRGKQHDSFGWVESSRLFDPITGVSMRAIKSKGPYSIDDYQFDENAVIKADYQYRITRGHGIPVCDAFLLRLKATNSGKPPYCDIPEDDSIPGFAKLHRVPLTPGEADHLFSHIFGLTNYAQQMDTTPGWTLSSVRLGVNVFAWGYNPPVSLNNDGVPENVIIWQGYGVDSFLGDARCGGVTMVHTQDYEYQPPQVGFVLTPDSRQVDESKTIEIFGPPEGDIAPFRFTSNGRFAPLGWTEGIIEFDGRYYVESIVNLRNSARESHRKDGPSIFTLAVFLKQNGKTRQMCEYHVDEQPAR